MDTIPNEIKAKIYSLLSPSLLSEIKYSSKDTFYAMRYISELKLDKSIFIKKLFIKSNNTFSNFYFNINIIQGVIIVMNIDELSLVHQLLTSSTMKKIIIRYNTYSIIDTFQLIQSFISSKHSTYLRVMYKDTYYLLTKISGIVIINLSYLLDEHLGIIDEYMKGVDAVLVNKDSEYCKLSRLGEFLKVSKYVNMASIDGYTHHDAIIHVLPYVNALYIGSQLSFRFDIH